MKTHPHIARFLGTWALLVLCFLQALGGPTADLPPSDNRDKNTAWVTGTVSIDVRMYSEVEFRVVVYAGHRLVASGFTECGLFKFDLRGKVLPDEVLTVRVKGARFEGRRGRLFNRRHACFKPTETYQYLENAQNLELLVEPTPCSIKYALPPRRSHCVPLYIENI